MKLAVMVADYGDGLLVKNRDTGRNVRVMCGDMVPPEWAKCADGELSDEFVEVPEGARAVSDDGLRVSRPIQSACRIFSGRLRLREGFVWAREDVPKGAEYKVPSLPAGVVLTPDVGVGCVGVGVDYESGHAACNVCKRAGECETRTAKRSWPSSADMPKEIDLKITSADIKASGRKLDLSPEEVKDHLPDDTLESFHGVDLEEATRDVSEMIMNQPHLAEIQRRYKEYEANQNRRRAMGQDKGRKWSQYKGAEPTSVMHWGVSLHVRPGDVMPTAWVEHFENGQALGFVEVPGRFFTDEEVKAVRNQKDGDWEKVGADELNSLRGRAAMHIRILATLRAALPGLMQRHNDDLAVVVYELLKRAQTVETLKADIQGMQDRDDGWESRKHRDGTFMSRDEAQSRGVVRRVHRRRVGHDDQSGEDVCADAGGAREWMK